MKQHPDLLKVILEEVNNAEAWAKNNVKGSADLLAERYKLDKSIMETVQGRAGDRQIVPVDDAGANSVAAHSGYFYGAKCDSEERGIC